MRCLFAVLFAMASLHAQTNSMRPHVLGLAHVAFRVGDAGKARAFYEDFLGYQEPFSLKDANGRLTVAYMKVNDRQFVELFQGDARSQGQFDHFAFYTENLAAMRSYLLAQQVPVVKDIHNGRIGNPFFTISDPDGHHIEIVQYSPTSLVAQAQGKYLSTTRVSSHIGHVGMLVSSVGPAMRFYRDILGFQEISRGGGTAGQPGWVDLRMPDSTDYIELIPFSGVASPAQLKAQNHLGLVTSDVRKTVAGLEVRANSGFPRSGMKVQTGGNLPPRTNLFDLDGVRIEFMEPVAAVPSPPSHASN